MNDEALDPRDMSPADFSRLGIQRVSRGSAIRQKCLDCMGGSSSEVRLCASGDCALWPFRMGTDPWRAPMTEEQRAAAAERFAAVRKTT